MPRGSDILPGLFLTQNPTIPNKSKNYYNLLPSGPPNVNKL